MLLALALLAGAVGAQEGNTVKEELERLQGVWLLDKLEVSGKEEAKAAGAKLTFEGEKLTILGGLKDREEVTFKINPTSKPRKMDITNDQGRTVRAIYDLDGDLLRICFQRDGNARPKEFTSEGKVATSLLTLKREVK
jgi:uncharacterized protein (TIGR03067 family)